MDGEQCALWNGTHMPRASWLPAKTTDACRLSRSGMMYKPLTDDLGKELLMSYLEGFRAKTFQSREREPVSTESVAECGITWQESLAKYDQNSSSWRTHQCLLFEDSTECLATFPRWGMVRDGGCWELLMLGQSIEESGSGLWPTPTTPTGGGNAGGSGAANIAKRNGTYVPSSINPNLYEWLMGWPIGWTDLNPLAMDKFRRWLDLHGKL